MRDITAQKNLETRLLNTQKLESLGTISSGIAHDFKNLLMAIQGNTSLISLDIRRNDPQYESLKNIEKCVKSGSELTRQLLGFAKGTRYELKPTDSNEFLQKSSNMFDHTRKEINIQKIEKEETSSEPMLNGEGTLLFVDDEEIILNIGVKMLKKLGYDVIMA